MATDHQNHPAAPTITEVAAAAGVGGRATVARTLGTMVRSVKPRVPR